MTAEKKTQEKERSKKIDPINVFKIALVGASGKGKTYSFRNMNREHTGFINTEYKPLPFKKDFKYHGKPTKWVGITQCFKDFENNNDINAIVLDSFSATIEIILEECRRKFSGFDIWTNYNKRIGEPLKMIKYCTKEVIMTAHYEVISPEGEREKRIKVKGNEWAGVIEKEFTVVLYSDVKFLNDNPTYKFKSIGDGLSAKCPPGILKEGEFEMDNDANEVLKLIRNFQK